MADNRWGSGRARVHVVGARLKPFLEDADGICEDVLAALAPFAQTGGEA